MENIFDTSVLVQVVPNLKTSQNWLLDRFFPNVVTDETEEVAIDVDVGLRRMAPFVSPLVEGKLVESRKYQTNTFKPAYIKDKRAPDLRKPIRRQIGERIGGEYTAAEREMLNLQFEMTDQIDMINRRLEWMAASALWAWSPQWFRWWGRSPPCSAPAISRWKIWSVPWERKWRSPLRFWKNCRRAPWCAVRA